MTAVLLVCAAKALYFLGFGLFKSTACRMKRLTANRPFEVAGQVLRNRRWLLGVLLVLVGIVAESSALARLPLVAALPLAGIGLLVLLAVAAVVFDERLTLLEWSALGVVALGLGLLALSVIAPQQADRAGLSAAQPDWKVALYVAPTLAGPFLLFIGRDSQIGGRHARRLTGVGYGIGAGVLLGCALVSAMGTAELIRAHRQPVLASPYPYVLVLVGGLGLGLLQIALQRCRLGIVITVATVIAEVYRVLVARLVYGLPWPHQPVVLGVQVAALVLTVAAVVLFPRHDRRAREAAPAQQPPDYTGQHRLAVTSR